MDTWHRDAPHPARQIAFFQYGLQVVVVQGGRSIKVKLTPPSFEDIPADHPPIRRSCPLACKSRRAALAEGFYTSGNAANPDLAARGAARIGKAGGLIGGSDNEITAKPGLKYEARPPLSMRSCPPLVQRMMWAFRCFRSRKNGCRWSTLLATPAPAVFGL